MKEARLAPMVVYVICPYCKELSENKHGSYMWEVSKINSGDKNKCSECGAVFKIPERIEDHI